MKTPVVALTFDDGPSEWTAPLLDVLRKGNARATFFALGCNVAGNEHLLERAVAEGHEVGVHGWDHKPADDLGADDLRTQTESAITVIRAAAGAAPRWWRPPWNRAGAEAAEVVELLGLAWVRPTLDSYDTVRREHEIVAHLLRGLKAGAIIGLHDGIAANGQQWFPHREHTIAAVRRLLGHCRSVTVGELLG